MLLSPAMSHTGLTMMMSFAPTNGRVKPDAIVDTITFGRPYGNACITTLPSVVPIDPPTPMMPAKPCFAWASSAHLTAPSIITAWHLPS